jgi:ATP-dependent RNA helicase RhlE
MTFSVLGLAEPIARALNEARHTEPTPIQAAAIPIALSGRDLIGIAQTGTGKTAAFALPILNRLAASPARPRPKSCRVLVLSPTRELSGQIVESFRKYGKHLRVSVALAIGGVPIGRQIRTLAGGVDILVVTPGRLIDLTRSRAVDLGAAEVLVLDEADRMLDMGFVHDVRRIVAMLPKQRQTLLFSATMPGEIAKLAGEMLNDPARVSVAPPASTADRVAQRVLHVGRAEKPAVLADVLRGEGVERVLVFTRTKHGADRVVRGLEKAGIEAGAIHGNKSQGQRERVLADFRAGSVTTLVATDIAARGIDVVGISHVVNFDLPNDPESYVHRIGRTARAGNAGIAVSLCSVDELPYLRAIEKLIRQAIPAEAAAGASLPAERQPVSASPRKQGAPQRNRQRPGNKRQRGPARPARAQRNHDGEISSMPFMAAPARPQSGAAG